MKKIWILGCLLSFFHLTSNAQKIPEHYGKWVVDNANMLTEQTEVTLTSIIRSHYDSSSNQVVVLTIQSLEGGSIEEFANRVFNTWQIGQKERNNGVLLLISKEERAIRIEVGYGLETYLTDLESADIIDYVIVPKFKKGNFDQGVIEGVHAIIEAINGTYSPIQKRNTIIEDASVAIFIIFVIIFLFASLFFYSAVKGIGGLGCSIMSLLSLSLLSIYVLPNPFNWIVFVGLIGLFLYRRIFSKKIELEQINSKRSRWRGGGWLSGGGSSWGGGGFSGGGRFSGGGGSSGGGGATGGW